MIELEALATLAANDPTQAAHCVRLLEWFDYRGHVCMVFERLGPSLYDLLRRNGYKPFPLPMVRRLLRPCCSLAWVGCCCCCLPPQRVAQQGGCLWGARRRAASCSSTNWQLCAPLCPLGFQPPPAASPRRRRLA